MAGQGRVCPENAGALNSPGFAGAMYIGVALVIVTDPSLCIVRTKMLVLLRSFTELVPTVVPALRLPLVKVNGISVIT